MKRSNIALIIAIFVCGILLVNPASASMNSGAFLDVPDNFWAKAEIEFLTERQIINGYADGRFGTQDPITRAQAAAIMIRALGWDDMGAQEDPGYPDVSPNHWAYHEIAIMKSAGFFAPEGRFQPNRNVTRAEMADMLVKTFDLRSDSGTRFIDVDRDYWAYDAINILAMNQITTGYADGSFQPEREVTRTEFAVFVARALNEGFRPAKSALQERALTIYDVEIGDIYIPLNQPVLLAERWMMPAVLFERMGYVVEDIGEDTIVITTTDGIQIQLQPGPRDVWVGDTLVSLKQSIEKIDGELYIEGAPILRVLEKPLVFYPEQRLVRLESPRITVADIKRNAPDTIVDVIHQELPYWQWPKRDHDYLEKMRLEGIAGKRADLLKEMEQLTEAFYEYEQEKVVIHGLIYYPDHVTGKIDAVTRGLDARYQLLYHPEEYSYPEVGNSGATGVFSNVGLTYSYLVADYMYEHYEERKQELIAEINRLSQEFDLSKFEGLHIHGIPFGIREQFSDGTAMNWSGKATSRSMLVTNSMPGTFIHEFGHVWDFAYGDHDAYLAIRGRQGYTPVSDVWENRVVENFAEDFVQAFLSEEYPRVFKAVFGEPTPEETANFRQWVKQREQELANELRIRSALQVNGAAIMPEVMMLPEGKLHIQGKSESTVYGWIVDEATDEIIEFEIPASNAISQTIALPQTGIYRVQVGSNNFTVLYLE